MNSLKEYIQERIEELKTKQLEGYVRRIYELQAVLSKIEEIENNK